MVCLQNFHTKRHKIVLRSDIWTRKHSYSHHKIQDLSLLFRMLRRSGIPVSYAKSICRIAYCCGVSIRKPVWTVDESWEIAPNVRSRWWALSPAFTENSSCTAMVLCLCGYEFHFFMGERKVQKFVEVRCWEESWEYKWFVITGRLRSQRERFDRKSRSTVF